MVMATMSNISDSDQKSVKEIFGLLSVVFGEGGKAVPEQRVFEALKNNDMNSDRAFTELEEELKRATWDTIPTKMKKKSDRSSQGGNRDINYNNRNNQAYTSGRGRGTPALRGGGTDMGRGRSAPNAPRNDDGYRARPRQDGGRAPVGQDGRGAGWGRPPANTVPRVGPLGEVQATSNSTSQIDDIQKTDPSLAQLSSIQTLPQTDAPIPPNQWSKGRPRTEEDIAMQAVVEPIPTHIHTPSNLPQQTQIPTQPPAQAPAQAPAQTSRPAMPAWSNAAQSRSIVADATSKPPEVSVAADVAAPLESLSSHEEQVPTPSNFTNMTGLDATFATMGFSDGGGQGTDPATTAPEVAVSAVSQEMSYSAWSDGAQEQSVTSAAKPQDSPPQPAQPVPQAQDQEAMHQMPSQLQGGQQLSQAPPAQTQAQVPAATEDYNKQAYSGYGQYGMVGGDYGAYGMDSSASRAMGRNGVQQVQGTQQSYSMAGGSSSASEQQMPGNAQWQQQANMMAANWMQYPGYNMAAPPQNFMFMQYPGYNPMNQMYSGQNYTQASGMQQQQQQQQQQTTKGGYGNQHAKKQQGYNNQGYGGNAFSGGGFMDGGAGASQDYYKSQASAAFPGGTGGYGGMYAPGMYGGMPSMPAGMDAMGAFGQQSQQSAFPMRGATAAAPTSSMAGGGRGMDMMGAYGSYMGYGEGEAKTGWGN